MQALSCLEWSLRIVIVSSLIGLVALVLYFTPLPDLQHASCIRPCHELDWPMICRFKFVFDHHQTLGGWCGDCPKNLTDCSKSECVLADGNTAKIVAVNKQYPGPSIQVCESDIIVVEVVNRLPGSSLAIHWVGQPQTGTPYMDGVPMITQCPIQTYTTFQYKFRASQHGTHFWKTHTGNEFLDTIFGAMVVRRSERAELMSEYYDEDNSDHLLLISEWTNSFAESSQPAIIINGVSSKMVDVLPTLLVEKDRRYRIRVAYTYSVTSCPVFVTVSGHTMLVLALDGHYIMPRNTSSVLLSPGERFDFVILTNKPPGVYSISVESNCTEFSGSAKLVYNTDAITNLPDLVLEPDASPKTYKLSKMISTVMRDECSSSESVLCLHRIDALKNMPSYLDEVDTRLFLPFDLVKTIGEQKGRVNNITFLFPPTPLISQLNDYYTSPLICNSQRKPKYCLDNSPVCQCVHIIEIPLNHRVELILVDKGGGSNKGRVFHFHGFSFYVVGVEIGLENSTPEQIKEKHKSGLLFKTVSSKPIKKDTVSVPKGGAVALRFKASNPGFWVLHDQSSSLWANGMNVVFQVGNPSDLPPIPDDFPTCGNWVGPEFFLI